MHAINIDRGVDHDDPCGMFDGVFDTIAAYMVLALECLAIL